MEEKDFINAIRKHSGIIHKVLYLYIDNHDDKQDLFQEIHLQAWKSIKNFKGNSLFSTWLYRVSLNTVLTYKKKKRISTAPIDTIYDPPDLEHVNNHKSDLLMSAIKLLSDIDKALITLHLEGYDNGEIAEILGISKNNVGVKTHRIKETLKQKLTFSQHG